jgi:hypothetical protein
MTSVEFREQEVRIEARCATGQRDVAIFEIAETSGQPVRNKVYGMTFISKFHIDAKEYA